MKNKNPTETYCSICQKDRKDLICSDCGNHLYPNFWHGEPYFEKAKAEIHMRNTR